MEKQRFYQRGWRLDTRGAYRSDDRRTSERDAMKHFSNELTFRTFRMLVDGEFQDAIQLERDFFYGNSKYCKRTVIPAGFTSDGASVPRWLWRLYPPFGKYLKAAVVHDWFCVLGHAGESPISSVDAAKVFREAMKACGVNKWRRNKMYWAVRTFGPKFSAK